MTKLLNFCLHSYKNVYRKLSSKSCMKVTVLGAAGKIGQPVCLMLKNSPIIDELGLYDVCGTDGIAMELGHVDTCCRAISYKNMLTEALDDAQIVAILANTNKTCTKTPNAYFEENAFILFDLMCAVAKYSPQALIAIGMNPLNSMVPLACEVLKKFRVFNPNHVFGIATVDVVRTNTFVAHVKGLKPEDVNVPIIGGFSEKTIVPVLSQTMPQCVFDSEELLTITENLQQTHIDDKVKSNYLTPAFAISRFILSLARAMKGEENIVECAYVASNLYSSLQYLISPIKLGIDGIQKNLGLPQLSDYESCQMHNAFHFIKYDIEMGEQFVTGNKDIETIQRIKKERCKLECPLTA